jgi:PPOX class probable F420-dependent enzyme
MGGMPLALDDDLRALLTRPSPCVLTTLLPDGSPHATEVWVDVDGDHVLVNSVEGHRKVRNVRSDPRVAVTVLDPDELSRYAGVRGRVVEITTEGAADHIEKLAHRYTGHPYSWYGGRDQVRVLLRIEAEHVVGGF